MCVDSSWMLSAAEATCGLAALALVVVELSRKAFVRLMASVSSLGAGRSRRGSESKQHLQPVCVLGEATPAAKYVEDA